MQESQRQGILDNARYLQNVRPIDPEEIHEYVEGQPHPAAVRQVLREEATALGMVETEDGTFVPAPDGPVSLAFHGIDSFPEAYARVLEDMLVEEYGPGWPDGESGDRLRSRIRSFKQRYLTGADVEYNRETALGYAVYHLPAYYAAVQYVLAEVADDGRLPASPRVLDVGAGVGGPALGIHDLLPADSLVEYHAVEPSAAAEVLDRLLDATGRNFHPTVHRTTAESFEPEGEYDVVLFANVLSELADPATVVDRYADALAEEGSIVALAPADRETATGLRSIERTVERRAGLTVYAPTVRLWPGETPSSGCWSFDVAPDLAVPAFQRRLDEGTRETAEADPDRSPGDGEFVNVDVQYAYGVWRTDGATRFDFRPSPDRTAKMVDADGHVTERVNLAAVKLSNDLSEGGNPLFLLGDGSQQTDHFAVVTRESALNRDLLEAAYGDPLLFENALVLWNDDEAAYNVVVDGETVVDRVPV
ncbi:MULTISPECIES: small ribosomal subunit Rsm22 family protein [Salinibaculum]|uniref:small ribosomal subunit Rsm22 family protein n=1 Tax=Salinibaculum TaxID=2732368 RepID=UPI0030D0EC63